jgi:hypothetical protein
MLLLVYFLLFQLRLFSTIINYFLLLYVILAMVNYFTFGYFILSYFKLYEVIVCYFWLLKVISPYVIIGYFRLYYHKLFVVTILVAIGCYFITSY